MSQASLFGLAAFLVALAVLKMVVSSRAAPSRDLTQPIDEDGNALDFDKLDDVDQWFVEEVHRRRVASGGHMRCDRCKKIVITAGGAPRVRLYCDPTTDRIFCEACLTPEDLERLAGESEGAGSTLYEHPGDGERRSVPGERRLRLVK